jgi:hypothetical protein
MAPVFVQSNKAIGRRANGSYLKICVRTLQPPQFRLGRPGMHRCYELAIVRIRPAAPLEYALSTSNAANSYTDELKQLDAQPRPVPPRFRAAGFQHRRRTPRRRTIAKKGSGHVSDHVTSLALRCGHFELQFLSRGVCRQYPQPIKIPAVKAKDAHTHRNARRSP